MKIIIACEYLTGRGGTSRQALELARSLQEMGHQVRLVARVYDRQHCYPELTESLKISAGSVITSPDQTTAQRSRRIPDRLVACLKNSLQSSPLRYYRAYVAMRRATVEYSQLLSAVVREWPDAVLNPHDFGPAAWAAARVCGARTIWQCNDPLYKWEIAESSAAAALRRFVVRLDTQNIQSISKIAVLDTVVGKIVSERYGKAVDVVRSGVDVARFSRLPSKQESRLELGLPERAVVFSLVTLLSGKYRRTEDALTAFGHLKGNDSWLLLAAPRQGGDIEYTQHILRTIERHPARARIRWFDRAFKNDGELLNIYGSSDAFIFPNVQQTWGLAVLEASAACCLPIISKGSGVSEVFKDGENGLLFNGLDVFKIQRLMETVQANPADAAKIGRRARDLVQGNYTWTHYARRLVALCEDSFKL